MLSKRLFKLRKEANLTQNQLSQKLGIARTTYSGYELGTSEPDNGTLEKIADFYGVTIDNLLGREFKKQSIEPTKLEGYAKQMADLVRSVKSEEKAKKLLDFAEEFFGK